MKMYINTKKNLQYFFIILILYENKKGKNDFTVFFDQIISSGEY